MTTKTVLVLYRTQRKRKRKWYNGPDHVTLESARLENKASEYWMKTAGWSELRIVKVTRTTTITEKVIE